MHFYQFPPRPAYALMASAWQARSSETQKRFVQFVIFVVKITHHWSSSRQHLYRDAPYAPTPLAPTNLNRTTPHHQQDFTYHS